MSKESHGKAWNLYFYILYEPYSDLFIIQDEVIPDDSTPITRREFILRLMATPICELRCQVRKYYFLLTGVTSMPWFCPNSLKHSCVYQRLNPFEPRKKG